MKIDTRGILAWVVAFLVPVLLFSPAWGLQGAANANAQAAASTANTASSSSAASAGKPHDSTYVIGPNDSLAINVWKEAEVSRVVPVRSDGKISLPLVGEVQASGETPLQLEEIITAKLKEYISDPEVTVMVQESRSQKFNVLGMVAKPGTYMLTTANMTVLDAIALAGGFRDFAKKKSIYVLRNDANGQPERLPFNYKEVIQGKNPQQNIVLKANDTIVVP
jgi:polysaccharide biosynthesis/export protein